MKREVERERELPAFALSVGELEVLWMRLAALFDDPTDINAYIHIRIPSEQLEFDSIEELRQYKRLPIRVTEFTVRLFKNGRSVIIYSGRFLNTKSKVSATSETEAWCAGAIDTVFSFVQSHKLWYNWFVSAPIGWILIFLIYIPWAVLLFMPKGSQIDSVIVFGWLGAVSALLLLYFGRERLLPSAVLKISESDGFVRKHVAELSLVIAIVSVILTIIGLVITK